MKNKTVGYRHKGIIVFTYLDGSLLNHDDYSWKGAASSLKRIHGLGIPLVICTSKTRLEVEQLQKEIWYSGLFIVGNGGGIFFPPEFSPVMVGGAIIIEKYRCIPLGIPYTWIRSFMKDVMNDYSIRGFDNMSIEVSQRAGLPTEKAVLAKAREFTEPFVMENEEEFPSLEKAANLRRIKITRGRRFFHFMGIDNDKGSAVKRVKEVFPWEWKQSIFSIGFGDSPNDFPFLKNVDIPVLIPHEDVSLENITLPGLIHASFPGSRGWDEAANKIISEIPMKTHKAHKNKYH